MKKIRFDFNGKIVTGKIKTKNGRHSGRKCVVVESGEYIFYLPVKMQGVEFIAEQFAFYIWYAIIPKSFNKKLKQESLWL